MLLSVEHAILDRGYHFGTKYIKLGPAYLNRKWQERLLIDSGTYFCNNKFDDPLFSELVVHYFNSVNSRYF